MAHPVFIAIWLLCTAVSHAALWQYSVKTDDRNGRAFLWIPPRCEHIRGVIIGQQVILESVMFEDPAIRAAAERQDLGIMLVVPAVIGEYDEKGGGAVKLQSILDGLAEVSGYAEISQSPLLTVGHSGGAFFAWNTAYWNPDRCIGVIGLKAAPIPAPPYARKAPGNFPAALNDVPVLVVSGQYESWGLPNQDAEYHWRWVRGSLLAFRAHGHNALMSALVEPGVTHFGWSENLAGHLAMFIEKAAQRRLPAQPPAAGQTPELTLIPKESGWLTDPVFPGPPNHQAAPWPDFKGDPHLAFWHLDGEIARANETYISSQRGKHLQAVTFVDAGGKAQQPGWLQEIHATPLDDGLHFRVAAEFVRETPRELSVPGKRNLGNAPGPILFRLLGGWAGGGEQTGPDTFRVRHDRFYFSRRSDSLMVLAWHPGDDRHAHAEQPCSIKLPDMRKLGAEQTITFKAPEDIISGTRTVKLEATSDSGLPVAFTVIDGPAEIASSHTLEIHVPPPRSKWPLRVTVAAWQPGRAADPPIRAAQAIIQSFLIHHP
jgi:hypothetical protein